MHKRRGLPTCPSCQYNKHIQVHLHLTLSNLYHVIMANISFDPEPLSLETVFLQQHINTMSNTMHTSPVHEKIPSINHHDMQKTNEKLISTKMTLYAGYQDEATVAGHEQHKIKTKSGRQWPSQHTQRTNTSYPRGYKQMSQLSQASQNSNSKREIKEHGC